MSDPVQPHRWQPTRIWPRGSLGKNSGVGCHFLLQCMKVKSESEVAQLCPTLSDRMDCSLPGSFVHGIFQARGPERGATAFSLCSIHRHSWKIQCLLKSCHIRIVLICKTEWVGDISSLTTFHLQESWWDIKMAGRNINNLRYTDDTTLWQKVKKTKEPLDESERGEWKSWLKTQHSGN